MNEAPGFHVTLLIGRRLYWEVRPQGIVEVPEVARDARMVLSFDAHDHRLAAPVRVSTRSARQAFMREWGEQVRVVNRSRDLAALYGRDPAHALARPAGCRLLSGLQLMDTLARVRQVALADRLLGLELGTVDGPGRRLVLLFAYDAQGELVRFQEAANPPSLDYLVDEFVRSLPAAPALPEPVWFDQRDVAAALGAVVPYPEEDTWLEIPQRRWWQSAAQANAVIAATAVCWSVWAACDGWVAQRASLAAQARLAELQAAGDAALRSHARSLAWSASADLAHAFRDAEQLWRPGTRVQVLATPEHIEYTLKPAADDAASGRPGQSDWSPHPLRASLDAGGAALPAGVRSVDPAIGGDLHAYYLRFRRETPLPAIAALADRGP